MQSKKLSQSRLARDVKKYSNGIRVVGEWNKLSKTVNTKGIEHFRKMNERNERLRDGGHECKPPSLYTLISNNIHSHKHTQICRHPITYI